MHQIPDSLHHVLLNQFYKRLKDKARAKPGDLMFSAWINQPKINSLKPDSDFSAIADQDIPLAYQDNRSKTAKIAFKNTTNRATKINLIQSESSELVAATRVLPYQDFLLLRNMLVNPEYRNQSIGTQLMNYTIQELKKLSTEQPQTLIAIPTTMAVNLYTMCGFKPLALENIPEQLHSTYRKHCHHHPDTMVMALNLQLR